MQKMIRIPKEQYEKMLETYDKAMEELEALRREIINLRPAEETKENSLPGATGQANQRFK